MKRQVPQDDEDSTSHISDTVVVYNDKFGKRQLGKLFVTPCCSTPKSNSYEVENVDDIYVHSEALQQVKSIMEEWTSCDESEEMSFSLKKQLLHTTLEEILSSDDNGKISLYMMNLF